MGLSIIGHPGGVRRRCRAPAQPVPFASWLAESTRLPVFYGLPRNSERPLGAQVIERDDSVSVGVRIDAPRGFATLVGGFIRSHATVEPVAVGLARSVRWSYARWLKFAGGRPTNRGVMDGTPHRFRLERIRSLRERSEDRAKQALAASLNHERAAADAVAAAAARIAAARESLSVGPGAAVDAAALFAHQTYLERTEAIHRASLSSLAGASRGVSERRGELVEAARARQSLDRLHDRSLAAHVAESGRRERATLDEIALNSFRRRAAA